MRDHSHSDGHDHHIKRGMGAKTTVTFLVPTIYLDQSLPYGSQRSGSVLVWLLYQAHRSYGEGCGCLDRMQEPETLGKGSRTSVVLAASLSDPRSAEALDFFGLSLRSGITRALSSRGLGTSCPAFKVKMEPRGGDRKGE